MVKSFLKMRHTKSAHGLTLSNQNLHSVFGRTTLLSVKKEFPHSQIFFIITKRIVFKFIHNGN